MSHYPSITWHSQVRCGRGSDGSAGDLDRAIELAQQLVAVGKWDGQGLLVIHEPHDTHRRVQHSHRGGRIGTVNIYVGIYTLKEGKDYEIVSDEDDLADRMYAFDQCTGLPAHTIGPPSNGALSPTHPDVLALLPIGTPTLEQMLALNRMADGGGDIARAAAYVLALIDADQVQQAWRMIDVAESPETAP